jgi:hypothetical protein
MWQYLFGVSTPARMLYHSIKLFEVMRMADCPTAVVLSLLYTILSILILSPKNKCRVVSW